MSFRLFIYYCALCGGAAAFVGWAVGRAVSEAPGLLATGVKGLWLGLAVALALSVVDTVWNDGLNRPLSAVCRVLAAVVIGGLGGFVGGVAGQKAYDVLRVLYAVAWAFVGVLIGASLGVFDLGVAAASGQDTGSSLRKLRNAVLGGGVGGLLGGFLALGVRALFARLFKDKDDQALWMPTAWGFVALGASIGLLIGLAQVILKEAWLKVEKGFRAGR